MISPRNCKRNKYMFSVNSYKTGTDLKINISSSPEKYTSLYKKQQIKQEVTKLAKVYIDTELYYNLYINRIHETIREELPEDLLLKAIGKRCENLKHIKNQTVKMIETALKRDALNTIYQKCIKNMTQEIADMAVHIEPNCYRYIPDKFKTLELSQYAVDRNSFNFVDIPEDQKTYDLCKTAVWRSSGGLLRHVKSEFVKELRDEWRLEEERRKSDFLCGLVGL